MLLGDRRALSRTRRELERLDDDDLLWLRTRGRAGLAPLPQARFNAGQKLHAVAQAALAVLLTVSGLLLWLGERDTAWRLPGSIALHDVATLVAGILVDGHVWMAISPENLPANQGILHGTVPADRAAEHHAKWVPDTTPTIAQRPGTARILAAALVVALGALGTAVVVLT